MTAPRLSELENWPLPSSRRRPTPQLLAQLAEVYGTSIHHLLDLDDREQMPPADLRLITTTRRDARSIPPRSPAESAAAERSPADLPRSQAGPGFEAGPGRRAGLGIGGTSCLPYPVEIFLGPGENR
jgi:hypothetical protein